jgi:hypothetical protein
MRNPPLSKQQWDALVADLLDGGLTISQAARHHGVSPQGVSAHLKRHRPYAYAEYWTRPWAGRPPRDDEYQALSMMLLNPRSPAQIQSLLEDKRLELDDAKYFGKPEGAIANLEAEVRSLETELAEASSPYEKRVRSSLERTEQEFVRRDWGLPYANPPLDAGRYLFVHACTGAASGRDIHALQRDATPITLRTFAQKIGAQQWRQLQKERGYGRHFPISRDRMVRYFKSTYRGVPAVYFLYSSTEYIYTLDGRLGPSIRPPAIPTGEDDFTRFYRQIPVTTQRDLARLPNTERDAELNRMYWVWVRDPDRKLPGQGGRLFE